MNRAALLPFLVWSTTAETSRVLKASVSKGYKNDLFTAHAFYFHGKHLKACSGNMLWLLECVSASKSRDIILSEYP